MWFYLPIQGTSHIFWSFPKSSPSCSVCGRSLFNVSGKKRVRRPPIIPSVPNTRRGRNDDTTLRYTTNGARILATYPIMCIKATPWALTTVGNTSAAYWRPILYEMFIQNRPRIAKEAVYIPENKISALVSNSNFSWKNFRKFLRNKKERNYFICMWLDLSNFLQ